ncbi:MAG: hypothetical protein ACRDCE_05930 [Cetobacterium sp.]|uniref:hypothetical protein n=1 Tax=Cetobacterium sp. TaxID=2071632 RepID=UPI003EE58054
MKITGTLKNAYIVANIAVGDIYGDIEGRFPDGSSISTSDIMKRFEVDGKTIIQTLSGSHYILEEIPDEDLS